MQVHVIGGCKAIAIITGLYITLCSLVQCQFYGTHVCQYLHVYRTCQALGTAVAGAYELFVHTLVTCLQNKYAKISAYYSAWQQLLLFPVSFNAHQSRLASFIAYKQLTLVFHQLSYLLYAPSHGSLASVPLVLQYICLARLMLLIAIGTHYLLTHLALLYHLSVSSAPCISVLGVVILTSYSNIAVCVF